MSKNQKIAIFAGLAVVFGLFFSEPLLSLFNLSGNNNSQTTEQMSQTQIQTQDVVVGQGEAAQPGDVLTVHYVGTLQGGQVFDSSRDRNMPFEFTLGVGQVIQGWDEGLAGMHIGGKRVVVIPPELGYGANAIGAIPANSILIFEVELLDVKKPQ